MPDDEKIALALYDSIYQVIAGGDPGSGLPSAFDTSTTRLVMAQRGLALNSSDYANPWTPGNPGGSIEAAANVAALVDPIPADSAMYAPTGATVSSVYAKMLSVIAEDPPLDPELEAKRVAAKALLEEQAKDDEGRLVARPTALADGEKHAFDDYVDALNTYTAQYVAAQADPALKAIWPISGAQALQRPKRAYADWGAAGRDQVKAAKAQLATLNEMSVAKAFADAQFLLESFKLVNVLSEEFYRTSMAPSDWSSVDGSSWPTYHFSKSTLDRQASSQAHAWGGAAGVSFGLWSFGGGVDHTDNRQQMSQDTSDVGLSFRWRICPIYRKWMDASLFSLPRWRNDGLEQHWIAGGDHPAMPLLPLALVLVRDVTITASFSHQDSEHVDSATSGSASVGWGPFSVSGHYSYSSTQDSFHAVRTNEGLSVPTTQVLGLVCLKVPPCPPEG